MTILDFLYNTVPGRACLRLLASRGVSRLCGSFLDTRLSGCLIPGFVRKYGIDLREYEPIAEYPSFNAFFTRRIRPELRPVDRTAEHLIAPCDGLLSVWPIDGDTVIPVKQSRYTLTQLLGDPELAERYYGGLCLVFRLCVNHYHRYAYVESGLQEPVRRLDGVLHTVRPVALAALPVFTQNSREYTVIHTGAAGQTGTAAQTDTAGQTGAAAQTGTADNAGFGRIVQMEVGAMLVGRIDNDRKDSCRVVRGEEKGRFLYGGSTVILLLEREKAVIRDEILQKSSSGLEFEVKLGEKIGHMVKKY